jgi:hypothetical protein
MSIRNSHWGVRDALGQKAKIVGAADVPSVCICSRLIETAISGLRMNQKNVK